jgi:hypothetical protein
MKPKSVAYLLILLLVPPWTDDYAAPAETSYDLATAENNEYLPSASGKQQGSGKSDSRRTIDPDGRAARPPAGAPVRGASPWTRPVALHAPPLLYLLMSLQR